MKAWSHLFSLALAFVCFVTFTVTTFGQTIVGPAVTNSFPLPERKPDGETAAAPASSIASVLAGGLPLFAIGQFAFRPHLAYRVSHATGIEAAPGVLVDTSTQSVSPGCVIEIGSHWHADVMQKWTWYSNKAFKDSSDQSADLSVSYKFDEWWFAVSAGYSLTHPILVEVARQTREESFGFGIEAHRQLTKRIRLDLGLNQGLRRAEPLFVGPEFFPTQTRDWSTSDALHYQITSKLGISAGATFGDATPTNGPAMTYTRPEILWSYTPTERIRFNGKVGYEERRLRGSTLGNLHAPVYTAGLHYQPFDTTTISVETVKGMALSYLADQVTKSSAWNASLGQRLLGFVYATLQYSQQKTRFVETVRSITPGRDDKSASMEAQLSMPLNRRGFFSIHYKRTRNSSWYQRYEFTSHQYGAELSFRF